MPRMLNHVGTCWGGRVGGVGVNECLQVYIGESEVFPKNTFSNFSMTIIILETVNSKNKQIFLEQSLKNSYS